MNPYWALDGSKLYQGNVLDVLAALESQSVHMVCTSPPYWGLRDYGIPPVEWPPVSYIPMAGLPPVEVPGCREGCKHEWEDAPKSAQRIRNGASGGLADDGRTKEIPVTLHPGQGQFCRLCGGWRGSLGLEPDPMMFVGHIVLIWRELRRVLRDDGTSWVNFGDSYANSSSGGGSPVDVRNDGRKTTPGDKVRGRKQGVNTMSPGLKPKDLIGIPWRVALALQADGWYLRSAIIWAKGISFCPTYSGSCMPESCRDRPTNSYEMVFLLAKSESYYYDQEAVRESSSTPWHGIGGYREGNIDNNWGPQEYRNDARQRAGRNLRSVWAIPQAPLRLRDDIDPEKRQWVINQLVERGLA